MKIERAIEILDPEHRECYDGMDEVNEACRMGMEAVGADKVDFVQGEAAGNLREYQLSGIYSQFRCR